MQPLKLFTLAAALAAAALVVPAHAARSCEGGKPTVRKIERGLELAQRTMAALDTSSAQVVVLARNGQDLSRYGVRYSHLGFAYRQADGSWRVVHKLNQCGTAYAAVYRQGLGEFFLDDLWRHEAAWVVPSAEVQQRLLPVLQDTHLAAAMHHRPYSIVSYAWGRKYQQSNQWALETLALAMEPAVRTRERAQAWLQFKGYQPATLRIGAMTRLAGQLGAVNVAFDDHPAHQRFADRIETVTVESVFGWMERAQLGGAPVLVRLP